MTFSSVDFNTTLINVACDGSAGRFKSAEGMVVVQVVMAVVVVRFGTG